MTEPHRLLQLWEKCEKNSRMNCEHANSTEQDHALDPNMSLVVVTTSQRHSYYDKLLNYNYHYFGGVSEIALEDFDNIRHLKERLVKEKTVHNYLIWMYHQPIDIWVKPAVRKTDKTTNNPAPCWQHDVLPPAESVELSDIEMAVRFQHTRTQLRRSTHTANMRFPQGPVHTQHHTQWTSV